MLPPLPPDVIRWKQDVYIDGNTSSFGFFTRASTNNASDAAFLETLASAYFTRVLPWWLNMMHSEASCTALRLYGSGINFFTTCPPNTGGWVGSTAQQVATGIKWVMPGRGRHSWTITYLPATPSAYIANHYQLSSIGQGNVRDNAINALQQINLLPAPVGGTQEMGTVFRKTVAGPLGASQFHGFADATYIRKLATCGRRIPPSGSLPPS